MGLDHGLRKCHYVKNWDHMKMTVVFSATMIFAVVG
jgi:hypothetical protein